VGRIWVRPLRKTLAILLMVPFLSGCGLLFVKGPPSGWQQIQDIDDLETLAITQPCTTTAKGILFLDGGAAAYGVLEVVVGSAVSESESAAIGAALAVPYLYSAIKGNQKVNESRAFNARLMLERRRGGASSLASHEWLNQQHPEALESGQSPTESTTPDVQNSVV